jgi:hypothetical protein
MLKFVHLFNFNKDARYHAMISQGLWSNPEFSVTFNMPFVSLAQTICPADPDLQASLLKADYIFRGDDEHFCLPEIDAILDNHDLWKRVIYYDFKDSPSIDRHRLEGCAAYIKRSWPHGYDRTPPQPTKIPILPMDFGLLDEYFHVPVPERKCVDIACLFPHRPAIGKRRFGLVEELLKIAPLYPNSIIGKATTAARVGRRALFDPADNNPFLTYLKVIKQSKIVFTAYPDQWDGDSRTWEAFSSRALVFMDETFIPSAHPFVNGTHCIVYNARDRASIRDAIGLARYYLANARDRESVAQAGYVHALTHHTPIARVKSIVDWVQSPSRRLHEHVVVTRQRISPRQPIDFRLPPPGSAQSPRPHFLGIGAQKAGTTWVFENLRLHPEIFMPPPKEIHFFDREYPRGSGWYGDLFKDAATKICGEITPAYAILNSAEIGQIATFLPDVKIFFIIRNPMERGWGGGRLVGPPARCARPHRGGVCAPHRQPGFPGKIRLPTGDNKLASVYTEAPFPAPALR